MKYSLIFTSALALAFAGCATNKQATDETQADSNAASQEAAAPAFEQVVHFAYQCQANGKKAPILVASYGIVKGEPVAAQLTIENSTSPALIRAYDAPNADTLNTFTAEGITWVTKRATLEDLSQAEGVILTRRETTEVNGKQEEVDNILLKYCTIDAKATQSLTQQPAQAAAPEAAKEGKSAKSGKAAK